MGIQHKGSGLWVSNKRIGIIDIQHKESGLWVYNTKDQDYGYATQRIGIIIQLRSILKIVL